MENKLEKPQSPNLLKGIIQRTRLGMYALGFGVLSAAAPACGPADDLSDQEAITASPDPDNERKVSQASNSNEEEEQSQPTETDTIGQTEVDEPKEGQKDEVTEEPMPDTTPPEAPTLTQSSIHIDYGTTGFTIHGVQVDSDTNHLEIYQGEDLVETIWIEDGQSSLDIPMEKFGAGQYTLRAVDKADNISEDTNLEVIMNPAPEPEESPVVEEPTPEPQPQPEQPEMPVEEPQPEPAPQPEEPPVAEEPTPEPEEPPVVEPEPQPQPIPQQPESQPKEPPVMEEPPIVEEPAPEPQPEPMPEPEEPPVTEPVPEPPTAEPQPQPEPIPQPAPLPPEPENPPVEEPTPQPEPEEPPTVEPEPQPEQPQPEPAPEPEEPPVMEEPPIAEEPAPEPEQPPVVEPEPQPEPEEPETGPEAPVVSGLSIDCSSTGGLCASSHPGDVWTYPLSFNIENATSVSAKAELVSGSGTPGSVSVKLDGTGNYTTGNGAGDIIRITITARGDAEEFSQSITLTLE